MTYLDINLIANIIDFNSTILYIFYLLNKKSNRESISNKLFNEKKLF